MKQSATSIRPAASGEAATLTAIAMYSKAYWPYSAAQMDAWRADLAISPQMIADNQVHVAEFEAQVAGFYVLLPQAEHWVLDAFWVLPDFMGRGIGRALLEHAVGVASQGGATMLTIDADPHAEAFYRACGARTVSTVAAPLEGMPGRVRPQMVLSVPRS